MRQQYIRLTLLLFILAIPMFILTWDILKPKFKSLLALSSSRNKITLLLVLVIMFNAGQAIWIATERTNPKFKIPGDQYRIKRRSFTSYNDMSKEIKTLNDIQNAFMELSDLTDDLDIYEPSNTGSILSGDTLSKFIGIIDEGNFYTTPELNNTTTENLLGSRRSIDKPTREGVLYSTLAKNRPGVPWRIFTLDQGTAYDMVLLQTVNTTGDTVWDFIDVRLLDESTRKELLK